MPASWTSRGAYWPRAVCPKASTERRSCTRWWRHTPRIRRRSWLGIELDRGLLVGALVAAGYAVHAINPLSVDRYRDRHGTSGAKSDPGDAKGTGGPRSDRSAPASTGRRGQRAGRGNQGAGPGPPEPDLVPPEAAQPAPQRAFGSSTRRRSRPSALTWPRQMPWPCSRWHPRRRRVARFPAPGSLPS
jgi:hypothetical protein